MVPSGCPAGGGVRSHPPVPPLHLSGLSGRFSGRWRLPPPPTPAPQVWHPGAARFPHSRIRGPCGWSWACLHILMLFCLNSCKLKKRAAFCFFSFLPPCCFMDFQFLPYLTWCSVLI